MEKKIKIKNIQKYNFEGINMTVQKMFRTYEQICLDKLKEIGKSSAAEWSLAMGYRSHNGLIKVIKRIQETMPEKLIIHYDSKPRLYEAS